MENESKNPLPSAFVDGWPDEAAKQRYILHAKEVYESNKALRTASYQGHVDYGKWLIASLLAVHGGAIYAINSVRMSVRPDQLGGLIDAAAWNLAGVFCILFAGFAAWLNFQFAQHVYDRWTDPAMLYRTDKWPDDNGRFDPINATLFLAAAFGMLSALSFINSALIVVKTLRMAAA